uniref:Formylglycine-generating enzyme, required for sulfatase activity, contains SUMF1/FGE domain n=1 Tax=Candidatus Kentrum sp. FW TaxID=2126338 RepID=A0A450SCQ7_9GAMM|nr:MAG: Formylglycine-generating enzyme, required for sulfatase activity, contains SUMF1/FGE domain [Candidatus Kentron sp. FW]
MISTKQLEPLLKKLIPLEKKRALGIRDQETEELARIGDVFGSPLTLVKYYIEPYCQHHHPVDPDQDQQPTPTAVRSPVFSTIDAFLRGDLPLRGDNGRRMFVLSDAGIGKTSLLMMIKLTHLMGFRPQGPDCLLLQLGKDTLERIENHPDKANTILLLDALDKDPLAWGNIEKRLVSILAATDDYHRVIISCRTRFFLAGDSFGQPGKIQDIHTCPTISLLPFDNRQVSHYLAGHFPDHWRRFLRRENPVRRRARKLVSEVESLHSCPLLLGNIDAILVADEAGNRQWNSYTLREVLIARWLTREESRLRKQLRNPPHRKMLWDICARAAVFLQRKGRRFLSRADLDALAREFPPITSLQHFTMGGRSFLDCNADGDLRFSSATIREFLVAYSIINGQVTLSEAPSDASLHDSAGPNAQPDNVGDRIHVTDQLMVFLQEGFNGAVDFALLGQLDFGGRFCMPMPQLHFHDRLADGSQGPTMQWIPAGEFLMGSQEKEGHEREYPQHPVCIAAPFALGTYPVTFAQYDHFCDAVGRDKPPSRGWERGKHPVIHVSRQDALNYCAWLSRQSGHHYRLPSEAEWEYAVRAGTRTKYWWGDEVGAKRANCHGCGSLWDNKGVSPVGSFSPNPFGLFDAAGNVWEWTEDCWHGDYQDAPGDGRAWGPANGGDCSRRVVRGGSWIDAPKFLRSGFRDKDFACDANGNLGFRVARDF